MEKIKEIERAIEILTDDSSLHDAFDRIEAKQTLLDLAQKVVDGGYVKAGNSVCSKHQEPDEDCEACETRSPFSIDTDKYCSSAGWVKKSETINILREIYTTMDHAEVFIRSREKMHPTGQKLYRELMKAIAQRIGK